MIAEFLITDGGNILKRASMNCIWENLIHSHSVPPFYIEMTPL